VRAVQGTNHPPQAGGSKRYIYLGRHLIAEDGTAGRQYLTPMRLVRRYAGRTARGCGIGNGARGLPAVRLVPKFPLRIVVSPDGAGECRHTGGDAPRRACRASSRKHLRSVAAA